jgi:hypothetical protein
MGETVAMAALARGKPGEDDDEAGFEGDPSLIDMVVVETRAPLVVLEREIQRMVWGISAATGKRYL